MDQLEKVFILGGSLAVTEVPQELITVLGSCVSVCLWDRKTKTGGMNHFLLPETVNVANSLDGGIESTRFLIRSMIQKTSSLKNIEARIYGGANRFFTEESFLHVGPQNIRAAEFVLEESGIPVALRDTGGEAGRKIHFNTQTGEVKVILIPHKKSEPS